LREHSNEGVLKKTDHNHLSWKLADQSIQWVNDTKCDI
jgi:hypothetical protein